MIHATLSIDTCTYAEQSYIYSIITYLSAIQYSRPGSTVMVFTDADAKDFDREQEVIDAATAKNIKISLVMTGQCSRRKRRDISGIFIIYSSLEMT